MPHHQARRHTPSVPTGATCCADAYTFSCVVEPMHDADRPLLSAVVRPEQIGELLGADVPRGAIHPVVHDQSSGQPCPCAGTIRYGGEYIILWAPPDGLRAGEAAEFCIELLQGPRFSASLPPGRPGLIVERGHDTVTVDTGLARFTHDLRHGGLISHIEYAGSPGRSLDVIMGGRLQDRELGTHTLYNDCKPSVGVEEVPGWQATVRVLARYVGPAGQHSSLPRIDYRFTYQAGSPFVQVDATVKQEEAVEWDELHLLEFRHKEDFYTHWAAGHPLQSGELRRGGATHPLTDRSWGALMNADDAMGLVGSQLYGIHDGQGGHGTYVHGPWVGHFTGPATYHGVLYVGPSGGSADALESLVRPPCALNAVSLRLKEAEGALEAAQDRLEAVETRPGATDVTRRILSAARVTLEEARRAARTPGRLADWQTAMGAGGVGGLITRAEKELAAERPTTAPIVLSGDSYLTLLSGDLCVRAGAEGRTEWGLPLPWAQLTELGSGTRFTLPGATGALWSLRFRHKATGESLSIEPQRAIRGAMSIETEGERGEARLMWEDCGLPGDRRSVDVTVTIGFSARSSLTTWRIQVVSRGVLWGLELVDFPRIERLYGGPHATLITPTHSGQARRHPALGHGLVADYPSSEMPTQFLSLCMGDSGLYLAAHDASARTKQFLLTPSGNDGVDYVLRNYPDEPGTPGAGYEMDYDAIVAVHSGGQHGAAALYREWETGQAPWCAQGTRAQRADVPG